MEHKKNTWRSLSSVLKSSQKFFQWQMAYPNYNKHFDHDVVLPRDAIMDYVLKWTELHCKHPWAWGHEDGKGYFSFTCEKEAMVWTIRWWEDVCRQQLK